MVVVRSATLPQNTQPGSPRMQQQAIDRGLDAFMSTSEEVNHSHPLITLMHVYGGTELYVQRSTFDYRWVPRGCLRVPSGKICRLFRENEGIIVYSNLIQEIRRGHSAWTDIRRHDRGNNRSDLLRKEEHFRWIV